MGFHQWTGWLSAFNKCLYITFQQKVAVKELNDNDDMMFLTEFLKEASVMLHLRHPNIIRMYGVILSPIRLVCMKSKRSPYRIQCNSSSNRSPYRIQCNSSSNRSPYRIQCNSIHHIMCFRLKNLLPWAIFYHT